MAVLYNRIDNELSERLKKVAGIAGLSVAAVVETILTERLTGDKPPRFLAVDAALEQFRKEKP